MAEQQTQPASPTPIFGSPVLNLVERIEEHAYYFLKELDFWLDRTQHPSTLQYQDILSLHPASLEQDIYDSAYMLSIEIELQEDIARMRVSAYAQWDRIASAEKPVIVPRTTSNDCPDAILRPLPRPLPPSSPPPFMDISPLGILGSIMWHIRTERPRSSVESYRSLNDSVTARLNRFLVEEDEYPKRYNIWQQHNLEVDTLKDAMLDDAVRLNARESSRQHSNWKQNPAETLLIRQELAFISSKSWGTVRTEVLSWMKAVWRACV
ncbi:hypothetical protein D6D01_08681 [Aureobasidium pullulans]|uniref:Uncharacterized protein n=1 Tax=Aureobasidium pullulans TaxID=5580 RepID=A0A4S9KAG2_AURPU|nr:hypothetical protein D6D01_08681 [Aureobasidium pullulans]